jgi:hypothetical protein
MVTKILDLTEPKFRANTVKQLCLKMYLLCSIPELQKIGNHDTIQQIFLRG